MQGCSQRKLDRSRLWRRRAAAAPETAWDEPEPEGTMPTSTEQPLLLAAGILLGGIGVVALVLGLGALLRGRPVRFLLRGMTGLVFAVGGALALALALGAQGYRALTGEQTAGRIVVQPTAPQRFSARFIFPDGRETAFEIAGDEIFVDAHILKWKPIATLVGLKTAYELDRIGGRYRDIEQERTAARTVHPLGSPKPFDLFHLRERHVWLAPLLDAEYGSASFVPVTRPTELQLRVSSSGLLIRP